MTERIINAESPERKLRAHDYHFNGSLASITGSDRPKNTPFIYAVMAFLALMIVVCLAMCVITALHPPVSRKTVQPVCSCNQVKATRGE